MGNKFFAHGFSPYQLVFGFNPKLPKKFLNIPPALEEPNTSKFVADNLNAMRSTRNARALCIICKHIMMPLLLLVTQCIIKEETARNGNDQVKVSVLMAIKY